MEETKAKLTSALKRQPFGSIAMADLTSLYKKTHKEKLDFKELGFESLQQLLHAMPDTVQVQYDRKNSDFRVILVNYEVNEAIETELNCKSQMESSEDASVSKTFFEKRRNLQGSSEDTPAVNHLRQKPIPTAFRGHNDWDLYLKGFPSDTKENDLMDVFKTLGCTRVRVKKRDNGTLYGFATFREYGEAEEAYVTLDGTEFRGRRLDIQFAKSSIASEDEIRRRLEKTQFTAEVTSSRHRKFSSDDGSFDRGATGQPYDVNLRRTVCQQDSSRENSSWLTWQPFAAPGYPRTEDKMTMHRRVDIAAQPNDNKTASGGQNKFASEETSSDDDGSNSSDKAELHRDRRHRFHSNPTRSVQLFPDTVVDTKRSHSKQTTRSTEEIQGQPRSFESEGKQNSARIATMFGDTEMERKQFNSVEATKTRSEATVLNEDLMGQVDSLSSDDEPNRLDSSRITELNCMTEKCMTERRSFDLEKNRSRNMIRGATETQQTLILNRDSVQEVSEHIRDAKDVKNCSVFNIDIASNRSLSKAEVNSSKSDDNRDFSRGRTGAKIEVHVSESINSESSLCIENLHSDNGAIDVKRSVENNPTLPHVRTTAFYNVSKWLRVYVRDGILLAGNILKWTKVYSRNELHLGQVKFQCRNLTQYRISSLSEISSSSNTESSLKPKTEPVSSESIVVGAEISSSSTQTHSLRGRCCENIPETMDVQCLQRMLKETQLSQGYLYQEDLPDELDLIVIHVCDSKHFWGTVTNSGEFMDEFKELFQMMEDITVKARPEFRLDRATYKDKRAGVLYQDTDWCRVWIRSRVNNSEVEVFYVDYGNSERRSVDDLWVLPRKSWDLRPMVLPFHLTGALAKTSLFDMVNTRIAVKLIRSQSAAQGFVVTVKPYEELHSVDIDGYNSTIPDAK